MVCFLFQVCWWFNPWGGVSEKQVSWHTLLCYHFHKAFYFFAQPSISLWKCMKFFHIENIIFIGTICHSMTHQKQTRTTRTPAFWDSPPLLPPPPPPPPPLTSDPKSKQDKIKVANLKKIAKNFRFWNFYFARNFTCDTPAEVAW